MRLLAIALVACACSAKPSVDPPTGSPPNTEALVVACCGDSDSTIIEEMRRYEATPPSQHTADIAIFPFRTTSGLTVRDRMIIRDQASWSKSWLNIVSSHSPVPPTPVVGFSRETIVVATMGQQNSGGHSVTIVSQGLA